MSKLLHRCIQFYPTIGCHIFKLVIIETLNLIHQGRKRIMISPFNSTTINSRSIWSSWYRSSFKISTLLLLFSNIITDSHNFHCRLLYYIQTCISSLKVRARFAHCYAALKIFKFLVFFFNFISQFFYYIFEFFYIIFFFLFSYFTLLLCFFLNSLVWFSR